MRNALTVLKSSQRVCLVVVLAGLALMPRIANAQRSAITFTLLYSFRDATGAYPLSGLVVDENGNLYGTTSEGGGYGNGTVFKVTPSGSETVLHSFKGGTGDGRFPIAGLVRDSAGNLYGTTSLGGAFGDGVAFKLSGNGYETVLHSFGECQSDGKFPSAGMVFDRNGALYGTTEEGGKYNFGTIFKIDKTGDETVVHSFAGNPTDGQYPVAGLTADAAGNLYGTTELGGASNDGTVFELDSPGKETILFGFNGRAGGANPFGGVILDSAGNLYGTTPYGANGVGVVFELTTAGQENPLYAFTGGNDGSYPSCGLVRDSEGNLYGTAEFGGANGAGTVFVVTPSGKEVTLHSFDGSDGADLLTPLVADSAGNLYGTATEGGANGQGTVFKISR